MEVINAKCRKVKETDLQLLMDWRMRPDITKYLNSNPSLTMEDQKNWFAKIKMEENKGKDRNSFYWVLEVDDEPVGLVSLVSYDRQNKKIHTGGYIAVLEKRSLRLAIDMQWNLYRYAFDVLGVNKVCEEVFVENVGVNKIMDLCGSRTEGVLRQEVFKDGKYYDVAVRSILKNEWDEKKKILKYNIIEFE